MPADGERQREPDGEGLNHVLEEQDQRDQRLHGPQEHDVAEASLHLPCDSTSPFSRRLAVAGRSRPAATAGRNG